MLINQIIVKMLQQLTFIIQVFLVIGVIEMKKKMF